MWGTCSSCRCWVVFTSLCLQMELLSSVPVQATQLLEVFHVNPLSMGAFPINRNTGSAAGDLLFDLKMVLMTPLECTDSRCACRNAEANSPDLVLDMAFVT
eukprot:TRINITY_DN59627_c0_g1_i1.p2 TRINITY_DN59627_c0_g1~~TRINITY_DN59627_c0_g1_i1.p2  ORF type:complete len:101 (-),score=15.49 TRINITY_DN59627_c0_g1_i1:257-559(-)